MDLRESLKQACDVADDVAKGTKGFGSAFVAVTNFLSDFLDQYLKSVNSTLIYARGPAEEAMRELEKLGVATNKAMTERIQEIAWVKGELEDRKRYIRRLEEATRKSIDKTDEELEGIRERLGELEAYRAQIFERLERIEGRPTSRSVEPGDRVKYVRDGALATVVRVSRGQVAVEWDERPDAPAMSVYALRQFGPGGLWTIIPK